MTQVSKTSEHGNTQLMGHNNPPVDISTQELEAFKLDCADILHGVPVANDEQLKIVDKLLKRGKTCLKTAKEAKEEEYRPAKAILDAVSLKWKPVLDGYATPFRGLNALMNDFKVAKQAAADKSAKEAAAKLAAAEVEAAAAHQAANAMDMDSTDLDEEKAAEVKAAKRELAQARKGGTKGLRSREIATVTDPATFFSWLQKNDRQAVLDWLALEATRRMNGGARNMDGVELSTEKYAV